jgi:hypothetical protein
MPPLFLPQTEKVRGCSVFIFALQSTLSFFFIVDPKFNDLQGSSVNSAFEVDDATTGSPETKVQNYFVARAGNKQVFKKLYAGKACLIDVNNH